MRSLLVATKNAHKAAEFRAILGTEWTVTDLTEHPAIPAPEETGKTFDENAQIKAIAASVRFPEMLVVADDSGLEVDALGGAPGVYSARYAGENATDAENRAKLLAKLRALPDLRRTARFHCVLAVARAGAVMEVIGGSVEGTIIEEERGTGGFGYDPIFVPDAAPGSTYAELAEEQKNRISHRAIALERFQGWMAKWSASHR